MRRLLLAVLAVLPFAAISCAVPSGPADENDFPPTEESVAATEPAEPTPNVEPGAVANELDAPVVPSAAFASLDALCAAQKELVRDRVAQAAKDLTELHGEEAEAIAPSCKAVPLAPKVQVKLRAPFLEVRSLEIETGYAAETHVVVRTAEGWRALPHASVTDGHMDPGCFSIERDTGIEAIRVEGDGTPTLVIVEGTDRGARVEEDADEDGTSATWTDLSQRVVACRLASCDEPVIVHVDRVPSTFEGGRKTELRFATTYAIDGAGRVRPKTRFEDVRFADE